MGHLTTTQIVLLVITAPIWLPLVLTIVGNVFFAVCTTLEDIINDILG